jgi:hypothetical protein
MIRDEIGISAPALYWPRYVQRGEGIQSRLCHAAPRCSESARRSFPTALRWSTQSLGPPWNRLGSWRSARGTALAIPQSRGLEAEHRNEGNEADPKSLRATAETP